MTLRTMPNERPTVATVMRHTLDLPRCCPISGNPQPGSTLTIRYCPDQTVLEVYSLAAHIKRFVGGSPDGIRNMETMIQQIALDCAALINVPVTVRADLILDTQHLTMTCRYDLAKTQNSSLTTSQIFGMMCTSDKETEP